MLRAGWGSPKLTRVERHVRFVALRGAWMANRFAGWRIYDFQDLPGGLKYYRQVIPPVSLHDEGTGLLSWRRNYVSRETLRNLPKANHYRHRWG